MLTKSLEKSFNNRYLFLALTIVFGGLIGVTITEPAYGGATVELDKKVYTWTDRVYITVVAPASNLNPNVIDIIPVSVSTLGHSIPYVLFETGPNTGIFTGYVTLTGDPNLKGATGVDGKGTNPTGILSTCLPTCGPTNGFLPAENSDSISVSFEFASGQSVTGSALIRWSIGQISWLQSSYQANGQGVLQIVDPDMNLNPNAIDTFNINVWSNSNPNGINLTMTETGQNTGIFQGTVYFTTNSQSSGNMLYVSGGDTVTGEYTDRTLPAPYTSIDQLRLTATTLIGYTAPSPQTPTTPTIPTTPSSNPPPLIIIPQNIVTSATSASGAQVNYSVTAVSTTGILAPTCTPASGSIFPIGVTTVSCSATDSSGNSSTKSFTVTVNPLSPSVPSWVKNLGAMWCSGQLDSSGFVQAIQWLIANHVIILPQTQQGSQSGTQNIPAWVKSDACFWSQGAISDQTFEHAIQYLVTNGIITS